MLKLKTIFGSLEDDFFLPNLCSPKAVFMLILIAELFVLIQVLAGPDEFDWNHLAITSVFIQWVSLMSGATLCALRPFLKKRSVPVIIAFVIAIVVIITALLTLAIQWMLWRDTFIHDFPYEEQLFRHMLVALIITAMLLRYFYVQQEARSQQRASLNARYEALQSRIRPHFLFNSMNIIASLIHIDQNKAEQVVEDLSDLFRSSLQEHNSSIPMRREIELCRRYLRIEQHRLGHRLNSDWSVTDIPEDALIPPLTLQPIIENAVYHGIQPLEKGGTVSVDIRRTNDNISIRVRNPVQNALLPTSNTMQGNHLAIKNIRSRLLMLFGQNASVNARLSQEEDGMKQSFETMIIYPYYSDSCS